MKQCARLHAGLVAIIGLMLAIDARQVCNAQTVIVPDTTLGSEASQLGQGNGLTLIGGGARRGANLFHSFSTFNVGTGESAFFVDPTGVNNILTRVTGGQRSTINGTLGVLGGANLFFLNPSGVIFGPSSSLSIAGSFIASTADALQLGDQGWFQATNPYGSNLLSINPSALFFTATQPQPIVNRSFNGLTVLPGRSLILAGGNLSLEQGGQLSAPGGRIELAALAAPATLSLANAGNLWQLNVAGPIRWGDIQLTDGAIADVTGTNGGNLIVHSHNLTLQSSALLAGINRGLGTVRSQAGDIVIHATGDVVATNGSFIRNGIGPNGVGQSGNIFIQAKLLHLDQESIIQNSTFGRGNSGDITINAQNIWLNHSSTISANTRGLGNGGTIYLMADQDITLDHLSGITGSVSRGARGKGSDLLITTGSLNIVNGSQLDFSTFGNGDAGNIQINARNQVNISGVEAGFASEIFSTVELGAHGQGGVIAINTPFLSLTNGGRVTSYTLGDGKAGDIIINAKSVIVDGVNAGFNSGFALFSGPTAQGNAGSFVLQADSLTLSNGGAIEAITGSAGKAGDITLNLSDSLTLTGSGSGIFANTDPVSSGPGGSIFIQAPQVAIANGAGVTVNSDGSGNGGNIEIQANTLTLDNQAFLTASTASGEGGNISITANNRILMTNSSLISAEAAGSGNGGNIQITTPFLIAAGNSDIVANAFAGNGGNIEITATGIFGIQPRRLLTPSNDINASSQFGLDGNITINNSLDPSGGLVPLPSDLVDLTNLVGQGCQTSRNVSSSEFYLTGRGGLPPTPADPLSQPTLLSQLAEPIVEFAKTPARTTSQAVPDRTAPSNWIEAQGWAMRPDGQLMLTAQQPVPVSSIGSYTTPCQER